MAAATEEQGIQTTHDSAHPHTKEVEVSCKGIVGPEDNRVLKFVITDATEDRDGDFLMPNGADLGWFLERGAILWAHQRLEPPIGKPINAEFNAKGQIEIDVQFLHPNDGFDADDPYFKRADHIYKSCKAGYCRSGSIGFLPKEGGVERRKDKPYGYIISEYELLEFSPLPIGSNRSAGIAKGFGDDGERDELLFWALEVLGQRGLVAVDKQLAERLENVDSERPTLSEKRPDGLYFKQPKSVVLRAPETKAPMSEEELQQLKSEEVGGLLELKQGLLARMMELAAIDGRSLAERAELGGLFATDARANYMLEDLLIYNDYYLLLHNRGPEDIETKQARKEVEDDTQSNKDQVPVLELVIEPDEALTNDPEEVAFDLVIEA